MATEMIWDYWNDYLRFVYPWLEHAGAAQTPATALSVGLAALAAMLFIGIAIYRRKKPRSVLPPLTMTARLEAKNAENSTLLAERAELYQALRKLLGSSKTPNNHQQAMAFIKEHQEIFELMTDALAEGSPQIQDWTAKNKNNSTSVIFILYEIMERAVLSAYRINRADRNVALAFKQVAVFKADSHFQYDLSQMLLTQTQNALVPLGKSGSQLQKAD